MSQRRTRIALVLGVVVLVGLACSFGPAEPTPTSAPPPPPPPTEPPAAQPPPAAPPGTSGEDKGDTPPAQPPPAPPSGGGNQTLTLVNNSSTSVCYVYISPTTDSTWGSDWLGASETVSSGSSRTFSVPSGFYDLKAEDCSHNAMAVEWAADLTAPGTWTISSAPAQQQPAPSSGGLSFTGTPNYGSVSLSAGFTPDPYTVTMTSGGTIDVDTLNLGTGCTGYATSNPDFRLFWSGSSSRLRIFFVASSGEDTTLIINDATATWRCNDDYSGLNPMVQMNNPTPGQIDIWVGSYSSGDYISGTLTITELSLTP